MNKDIRNYFKKNVETKKKTYEYNRGFGNGNRTNNSNFTNNFSSSSSSGRKNSNGDLKSFINRFNYKFDYSKKVSEDRIKKKQAKNIRDNKRQVKKFYEYSKEKSEEFFEKKRQEQLSIYKDAPKGYWHAGNDYRGKPIFLKGNPRGKNYIWQKRDEFDNRRRNSDSGKCWYCQHGVTNNCSCGGNYRTWHYYQ